MLAECTHETSSEYANLNTHDYARIDRPFGTAMEAIFTLTHLDRLRTFVLPARLHSSTMKPTFGTAMEILDQKRTMRMYGAEQRIRPSRRLHPVPRRPDCRHRPLGLPRRRGTIETPRSFFDRTGKLREVYRSTRLL